MLSAILPSPFIRHSRAPAAGMATDPVIARLLNLAAKANLAEIEESVWFRTPSLKVAGKSMMRIKDADTLVFRCTLEDKEMLIAAAPKIYFETDHYKGWPAVLVRLSKANDKDLTASLIRAWRLMAPKRLTRQPR
jgi:hypothetical protein